MDTIARFVNMALHGVEGIQLNNKHDYSRYIPSSIQADVEARWMELGDRMRKAADRVAEGNDDQGVFR